eukprot:499825-Amphidinium_carterae.1
MSLAWAGEYVAQWKKQIDLVMVMKNDVKRALNGLKKRVERLFKEDHDEKTALGNFKKLVLKAQQLEKKQAGAIAAMVKEGVAFPLATKLALVERQVLDLLKSGQLDAVLLALSPWEFDVFNPSNPTVAALEDDSKKKCSLYQTHLYKDMLANLLSDAQENKEAILVQILGLLLEDPLTLTNSRIAKDGQCYSCSV